MLISKIKFKDPINLTKNAAMKIKNMLTNKKSDIIGVKIGVKRRGCNGYSYNMNYGTKKELESNKYDIVKKYGTTILVDPKSVFFIAGTTMDWEETNLSSEFTFKNPNSKGNCGCGESFNI